MENYAGEWFPRGPMCESNNPEVEVIRGPDGVPLATQWFPEPSSEVCRAYSEAELAAAEAELRTWVEVFSASPLNAVGDQAYAQFSRKNWTFSTDRYLTDRNGYFGSITAYEQYKQIARAEINGEKPLINRLEPNMGLRKAGVNWQEAQVTFYTWTRKGYEKALAAAGRTAVIPDLIRAGQTEKLKAALANVRHDYSGKFAAGGFNARPMKLSGKYRLGTLSDHALGTAVDVNDTQNAQLTKQQWDVVVAFTGDTTVASDATRKSLWKNSPEELVTAIQTISDSFVSLLQDAVAATKETEDKKALAKAIQDDEHLRKQPGLATGWRNGFFNLPWALVKEFHEEGFLWGATFSSPDFHHFEL
jgi:hypothetical protein